VAVGAETERERAKRRHQRTLFDGVAQLYDASRLGYPIDIVEFLVATASLGAGSTILEVGCGTGQLTERLAHSGFDLTAIDIGPSMITAARLRLDGSAVSFEATAFEDFAAAEASFDLIVSGTAFHWIDPEVKFHKSAQLLRPGGWLALLATGERYDDPFGADLLDMWVARSDDGGAWVKQRKLADTRIIAGTGLFAEPIQRTDAQRVVLPVEVVVSVENTRASSLSWPDDVRQAFTDELRLRLRSQTEVHLTQQTTLTMARVR
jgi:ubiquinone/menaquinone biosynthesis C-methylase UbiE